MQKIKTLSVIWKETNKVCVFDCVWSCPYVCVVLCGDRFSCLSNIRVFGNIETHIYLNSENCLGYSENIFEYKVVL